MNNITQNTLDNHYLESGTEVEGAPVRGAPSTEAPLPCLYRNNSIEINTQKPSQPIIDDASKALELDKKYRKTSTALAENVQALSKKYGLKNLGFLTLTFADFVTDYKEASKRLNSLASNVLKYRYKAFIKVMERCKSGRIHYHLLVVLDGDIRTGFDFQGIARRDYSSANKLLRSEWSFWRSTAKKYKFGRTELLPIKSSSEAIGRYVGKYISKHMEVRTEQDKGARLVSYSKGARVMNTKFSWYTEGAYLWRCKVRIFAHMVARRTGCDPTFEGLRAELGPKWAYHHREYIAGILGGN